MNRICERAVRKDWGERDCVLRFELMVVKEGGPCMDVHRYRAAIYVSVRPSVERASRWTICLCKLWNGLSVGKDADA